MRKFMYFTVPILLICSFILGCGLREQASTPAQPVATTGTSEVIVSKPVIHFYKPSADFSQIMSESIESTVYDDSILYTNFLENKVFKEDVVINSIKLFNEESARAVSIDFNKEFIDYLNSVNTAQEFAIITSITNTYLDFFNAERLYITINGKTARTKNKLYNSFLVKYEGITNPEYGKFTTEDNKNLTDEYTRAVEILTSIQDEGNIIISPLLLKTQLFSIHEGVVNRNKEEIATYLEDTENEPSKIVGALALDYLNFNNTLVYHSDRISEVVFKETFLKNVIKYNTTLQSIDYTVSTTVDDFNKYVNSLTNNEVNMFTNVDRNDGMYSIATLDFNAVWGDTFDEIIDMTFTNSDSTEFTTQALTGVRELEYFETSSIKGFVKNLEGDYSFVAVLPKMIDINYADINFNDVLDYYNLEEKAVRITIPKTTIENSHHFAPFLKTQGIEEVFTFNDSDFSEMFEDKKTFLTDVLQYNRLDIKEEALSTNDGTLNAEVEVILDQPFLFMIYDNANREMVLIGKVNNLGTQEVVSEQTIEQIVEEEITTEEVIELEETTDNN